MVECTEKSAKGLLSAEKMMEKLALAEAEKATEAARSHAAAEAEKKALLDKLTSPVGRFRRRADEARFGHYRARGIERPY